MYIVCVYISCLYIYDTVEEAQYSQFMIRLLLFYHETPEWPTRLNEVYFYLCIYVFIYLSIYIRFIYIWHRSKSTILTVYNSVALFQSRNAGVADQTERGIFIYIYQYMYIVYVYISCLYIYNTVEEAQYSQFIIRLLLFYHETPEWPTRLNEVYLYTHIMCIRMLLINRCIYVYMLFIPVWPKLNTDSVCYIYT